MKLFRMQIVLEKSQYEILTQIAREQNRSPSEVLQGIIDRELRCHPRRQMALAAYELQLNYNTNPDLNEFNALDGDNFH